MASAGARRYVRMSIGPNIVNDDRLALLAHEFLHALEIAAETVRDGSILIHRVV